MDIKRLSDIATEIGFQLLTSGAEIHRVEDTICRIAGAYGARADVFAIPASLVVTIGDREGHTFTQTRRVTTATAISPGSMRLTPLHAISAGNARRKRKFLQSWGKSEICPAIPCVSSSRRRLWGREPLRFSSAVESLKRPLRSWWGLRCVLWRRSWSGPTEAPP